MRRDFFLTFFTLLFLSLCIPGFSQVKSEKPGTSKAVIDSLKNSGVIFHENQKNPEISLSKEQAVEFLRQRTKQQYWNNPMDPFRVALNQLVFEASHERFDSAEYYLKQYPYDSLLIPWDKFYIWEPLRLKIPVIPIPEFPMPPDSVLKADTAFSANIDSTGLNLVRQVASSYKATLKDTVIMVVIDTLDNAASSARDFRLNISTVPIRLIQLKLQ